MKRVQLPLDLINNVPDTEQILPGCFYFLQGDLFTGLVFSDTGSLFDQKAPLLRFCHQNHADTALLDN